MAEDLKITIEAALRHLGARIPYLLQAADKIPESTRSMIVALDMWTAAYFGDDCGYLTGTMEAEKFRSMLNNIESRPTAVTTSDSAWPASASDLAKKEKADVGGLSDAEESTIEGEDEDWLRQFEESVLNGPCSNAESAAALPCPVLRAYRPLQPHTSIQIQSRPLSCMQTPLSPLELGESPIARDEYPVEMDSDMQMAIAESLRTFSAREEKPSTSGASAPAAEGKK